MIPGTTKLYIVKEKDLELNSCLYINYWTPLCVGWIQMQADKKKAVKGQR